MRDAFLLGLGQMLAYGFITVNMRAVAGNDLGLALLTDGLLQTVNFFLIRRMVKSEADSIRNWIGYTTGGLIGTAIGMKVS